MVRGNKLESCYLAADLDRLREAGVSPKGNTVHLIVAAWPWGAYLGEEGMRRGIRVKTSSYTRHHVNVTMTQAKAVANYANSILANMEALDDGYDEALLLDASGFVSEGRARTCSSSRRASSTPPTSRRALDGITRDTILAICGDLGLKLVENASPATRSTSATRLLHRHRRRGDADPRARPGRARLRATRPDHREDPGAFFDIVNGRNPKYADG